MSEGQGYARTSGGLQGRNRAAQDPSRYLPRRSSSESTSRRTDDVQDGGRFDASDASQGPRVFSHEAEQVFVVGEERLDDGREAAGRHAQVAQFWLAAQVLRRTLRRAGRFTESQMIADIVASRPG